MCRCICLQVYVYLYTYICRSLYMDMHGCVCVCARLSVCLSVCLSVWVVRLSSLTHSCMYVYKMCMHMCMCMYMYMYTCTYGMDLLDTNVCLSVRSSRICTSTWFLVVHMPYTCRFLFIFQDGRKVKTEAMLICLLGFLQHWKLMSLEWKSARQAGHGEGIRRSSVLFKSFRRTLSVATAIL